MSAPVMIRSQYGDLYGSSMLPVLEELFRSGLDQHPQVREMLFKKVSSDRDIWQYSELHDMPMFSEIAEGNEYSYNRPKPGSDKTLTAVKYGLGFSISDEAIDDGKFGMIADAVAKMAKSARETQEISAMNVFNNGFGSELTADGLSVFHTAHTLPSGLTFRNRPSSAVDLSQSALDAALADFDTQFIGDSGIIYRPKAKVLLVHPTSKRYAMELVGSDLKPDSSDNNMNSLKQDGLRVIASPHLTDQDAWFLCADPAETGLRIVARSGIQTKSEEDFDTDSVKYKSRYRESLGCMNAYGIWGSPGV